MKKLESIGKPLSRNEMKGIKGGLPPTVICGACKVGVTASCISQGNPQAGCADFANGYCSYHGYCPQE
jgi:hypothetical protein